MLRGVVRPALIGCAALALLAAPAAAAPMTTPGPYVTPSFGQAFNTEFSPNIVNLWTNKPTTVGGGFNGFAAGSLPSGWTYYQNDVTGSFVQLATTAPPGGPNFTWTQFFSGPQTAGWSFDWQEVNFNYSTGAVTGGRTGNLTYTGSGWAVGVYGSATGTPMPLLGPVPEPGTFLLVGLGAAALLFVARRRAAAPLLTPVGVAAPSTRT